MGFTRIVTHVQPYLDDIAGIWLLLKFGASAFPGIDKALVEFWTSMPEGRTPKDLERDGILLVGIGGGRFDEHSSADGRRKGNNSSLTLIAKELYLDEDPALQPLFNFILKRDSKLVGSSFDLHGLTKTMYSARRDDMTVWKWVFEILEAIYAQNLGFFEQAGTDLQSAKVSRVPTANNGSAILVVGNSDSREFSKYARSSHGRSAGIVIQRNSSGSVQVQTYVRSGINLIDTVQIIRTEEMKVAGKKISFGWEHLGSDGTISECPEWHYAAEGQMLLNGSATHKKPPTKLPLERISELVQIGINPKAFEPTRKSKCQQGVCSSTEQSPCPWHGWELYRCRRVRHGMWQTTRSASRV